MEKKDLVAEYLMDLQKRQVAMDPEGFSYVEQPMGTMKCPHTGMMCINDDNSCYCCDANPDYPEYEAAMLAAAEVQEEEDKARQVECRKLARKLYKDPTVVSMAKLIEEFQFLVERMEDREQLIGVLQHEIHVLEGKDQSKIECVICHGEGCALCQPEEYRAEYYARDGYL